MSTVFHAFLDAALQHPQRPALHTRDIETTYADLLHPVQHIRQALATHALGAQRIGLRTGDSLLTYAGLLAIMGNGAAYVPLNHHNPAERTAAILADADLQLVLSDTADPVLDTACAAAGVPVLRTDGLGLAAPAPSPDQLAHLLPGPDHMAYLLFTSGSTGRPKGVPLYHRNVSAFFAAVQPLYNITPADRVVQMFELTFDLSVFSTFAPLTQGACCVVVPERGVSYLSIAATLEEQAITVALLVPSVLNYLRPYFDELELPHLRLSLFCGEALPQDLVEAWHRALPPACVIENVYGPTEATIFCTRYVWHPQHSAAQAHHGVVPIGKPLPGMTCPVLDADTGQPQPHGQPGELALSGPQVTTGYWRNPDKTQAAFVPAETSALGVAYYKSGDRCFVDADGDIIYAGRMDHQVKIDGYRIELGEIEHHARQHLGTGVAVAVVAVPQADGKLQLALFHEAPDHPEATLRAHLQAQLPPYMQPRTITPLAALPLNLNGKIDRPALVAAQLAH